MRISYPIQPTTPNHINFFPTGGPNGDPAFQIDLQGPDTSAVAFRAPLIQESDWDTSIEWSADTTNLAVTSNGFEGMGIRYRLLRAGEAQPIVLFDNGLLSTQNNDWETVRTTWSTYHKTLNLPNVRPDVLDVWLCGRGPVGGSFRFSNITVLNKYSRTYGISVPGESLNVQLQRRENTTRNYQFVSYDNGNGPNSGTSFSATSITETFWEAYLDTIPANIQTGERVNCSIDAFLAVSAGVGGTFPLILDVSLKIRSPEGNEIWKQLVSETLPTAFTPMSLYTNTIEFIADRNYNQIELVISVRTSNSAPTDIFISRRGIAVSIISARPVLLS